MPRRPYGHGRDYSNEQQQQQTVQGIPYVSLYDPNEVEAYAKVTGNMQQRYDVSQGALSKYLEDYSNTNIDKNYIGETEKIVNDRLENMHNKVSKDYQGDYGAAMNTVIRDLSSARKPIAQAAQATKERDEARKLYQQAAMDGNINREYDPSTGEFNLKTFEQIAPPEKLFNEEGTFRGIPDYMGMMRGAGDHTRFIRENFSAPLQDMQNSSTPEMYSNSIGNFIKETKGRGTTDKDVDKLLWKDKKNGVMSDVGETYYKSFVGGSKFAPEEFQNASPSEVLEYVGSTIKSQTVKSNISDYQYLQPDKGPNVGPNGDPNEDPYGAETTGASEANAFYNEPGEKLADAFDKKTGSGFFDGVTWLEQVGTGDWNDTKQIDDEISETKNDKVLGKEYKDKKIAKLQAEKDRMGKVISIVNEYKKEKSIELKNQGIDAPTTNKGWAEMYDSDEEYKTKTTETNFLLKPTQQKGINEVWKNNPGLAKDISYRISGEPKLGNVGSETAASKLDISEASLDYQMRNNDKSYNFNTGEFFSEINNGGIDDKGKFVDGEKGRKVYYSLDRATSEVAIGLKQVKEIESNDSKEPKRIYMGGGVYTIYSGTKGEYTMEYQNPNGSGEVVKTGILSVRDVRTNMKKMVGAHLKSVYTLK